MSERCNVSKKRGKRMKAGEDAVPPARKRLRSNKFASGFTHDAGNDLSEDSDEHLENGEEEPCKKVVATAKISGSKYGSNIMRMMVSMGYSGAGLGREEQGRLEPVEESKQRGRRGLGHVPAGFEPQSESQWDPNVEVVLVEEVITWMPFYNAETLEKDILKRWVKIGKKRLEISNENHFCHPDTLAGVLGAKTVFDTLEEHELRRARTRSNPFETLGKLFFQNRAALKMANLDAMFDFMFTKPKDNHGHSLVKQRELLYFADVCAGPGGFSEYVLWRRREDCGGFCEAKGFGFTLRQENDFKLHDFYAAPAEFFEPYYGVGADGDVYSPENQRTLREFVFAQTGGLGVHFMMADGGFSVEGQENVQEILSKQLYLCQCLAALGLVRTGGHFVCKLFDLFTPFSIGLIYLMRACFQQICLHKPNTSRPANSERYIICKWKRNNTETIYRHLFEVNERIQMWKSTQPDNDVSELVPLDVLKDDQEFYDYICTSNDSLGEQQIIGLQKIREFCRNSQLVEERQNQIRQECLTRWRLPDKPRVAPARSLAKTKADDLLGSEASVYYALTPIDLNPENCTDKLRRLYDYRFVFLATEHANKKKERGFYLGTGGKHIFRLDNHQGNYIWAQVNLNIELPVDTLVYAEHVMEYRGEYKGQRKLTSFHLIDAVMLNGKDVRSLHLVERHDMLRKFAMGINKPSGECFIRCKELFKLEDLEEVLGSDRLDLRFMKSCPDPQLTFTETLANEQQKDAFYTVSRGLLFLRITEDPWMMAWSRSNNRKYFYNTQNNKSVFEIQQEFIAPFKTSLGHSLVWWWDAGVQVLQTQIPAMDKLHLSNLLNVLKPLKHNA